MSLRERSPLHPLFGSTTTLLTIGSEAESADLLKPSRFSELKLLGDGFPPPPVIGISPTPSSTRSRPVAPICGAPVQELLSESPDAEVSML